MLRVIALAAVAVASVGAVALAATGQPAPPAADVGAQGAGHDLGHGMMMRRHLARLDADHDGVITRAEFMARPQAVFDRLDANHDGRITPDEIAAARPTCKWQGPADTQPREVPCGMAMHRMHAMAHGGWSGGPGGPDAWGGGPARMPMAMAMMHHRLERLDTNHDGRISFAEMEAPLRAHFEMLDKNKDGFIEKDELPGHGMGMGMAPQGAAPAH